MVWLERRFRVARFKFFVYITMSSNVIQCALCALHVADMDLVTHASKSHADLTVRDRNGRLMTDAVYVVKYSKPVKKSDIASSASAVRIPGISMGVASGTLSDKLMKTPSTLHAAGSTLTAHAIGRMYNAIATELSYEFDRHNFLVTFAHWYASTTGSVEDAALGSFDLCPDPDHNPSGATRLTQWSEIFNIWAKYGISIGISDLTPRKFFDANVETIIKLYRSSPTFADLKTTGTKYSNDAGFPKGEWYLALPGVFEHSGIAYTEEMKKLLLVRYGNAVTKSETSTPYSMKFDPTHAAVNAVPAPNVSQTAAQRLQTNIGMKGLISNLGR